MFDVFGVARSRFRDFSVWGFHGVGFWVRGPGFLGFRIGGSGFLVRGSRFSGFLIFGFRALGFEFEVWGSGVSR